MDSTTYVTIGSSAPEFRAPTSNGQTLDRASFLGRVPVALVFPAPDAPDLSGALTTIDERLVEFGHRRTQVLAVVDESPRTVRELAERIPLHALTLLADQDGSIREAYAPDGAQCYLLDVEGRVRAVVPFGAHTVDELLEQVDALGLGARPERPKVDDLMDRIAPHEIPLAAEPASVAAARRYFSAIAADAELPDDVRDAGVLAVSELVTNAVLHGGEPITLRVTTLSRTVRVAVSDGNSRPPRRRSWRRRPTTDESGNHGRGLAIVERLADQWGCAPAVQSPGKTVWCNFRVGPRHP